MISPKSVLSCLLASSTMVAAVNNAMINNLFTLVNCDGRDLDPILAETIDLASNAYDKLTMIQGQSVGRLDTNRHYWALTQHIWGARLEKDGVIPRTMSLDSTTRSRAQAAQAIFGRVRSFLNPGQVFLLPDTDFIFCNENDWRFVTDPTTTDVKNYWVWDDNNNPSIPSYPPNDLKGRRIKFQPESGVNHGSPCAEPPRLGETEAFSAYSSVTAGGQLELRFVMLCPGFWTARESLMEVRQPGFSLSFDQQFLRRDIGPYVSRSTIFLHEMMHHLPFDPHIEDEDNRGKTAYGMTGVQRLGTDMPDLAKTNADSYALYALALYLPPNAWRSGG